MNISKEPEICCFRGRIPYYFMMLIGNAFTNYMTEIYLLHLLIAALVLMTRAKLKTELPEYMILTQLSHEA